MLLLNVLSLLIFPALPGLLGSSSYLGLPRFDLSRTDLDPSSQRLLQSKADSLLLQPDPDCVDARRRLLHPTGLPNHPPGALRPDDRS